MSEFFGPSFWTGMIAGMFVAWVLVAAVHAHQERTKLERAHERMAWLGRKRPTVEPWGDRSELEPYKEPDPTKCCVYCGDTADPNLGLGVCRVCWRGGASDVTRGFVDRVNAVWGERGHVTTSSHFEGKPPPDAPVEFVDDVQAAVDRQNEDYYRELEDDDATT